MAVKKFTTVQLKDIFGDRFWLKYIYLYFLEYLNIKYVLKE